MDENIKTLRAELFATIRALRDPTNPMDVARARAVSEISQTLLNSAKLELQYRVELDAQTDTGFLPPPAPAPRPSLAGPVSRPALTKS